MSNFNKEREIKMAEERETIGKIDVVNELAEDSTLRRFDMSKADIRRVLDAFYGLVVDSLVSGKDVRITGFGKFTVRKHAAREGRDPQTGEKIQIAASKAPAFKPGVQFKKAVNK